MLSIGPHLHEKHHCIAIRETSQRKMENHHNCTTVHTIEILPNGTLVTGPVRWRFHWRIFQGRESFTLLEVRELSHGGGVV